MRVPSPDVRHPGRNCICGQECMAVRTPTGRTSAAKTTVGGTSARQNVQKCACCGRNVRGWNNSFWVAFSDGKRNIGTQHTLANTTHAHEYSRSSRQRAEAPNKEHRNTEKATQQMADPLVATGGSARCRGHSVCCLERSGTRLGHVFGNSSGPRGPPRPG